MYDCEIAYLNPKEEGLDKKFLEFLKDAEGATAVEYGIMAVGIAAVIIAVVVAVGGKTNNALLRLTRAMLAAVGLVQGSR